MQYFNNCLSLLAFIVFIFSVNSTYAMPQSEDKSKEFLSANASFWQAHSIESDTSKSVAPVIKSSQPSEKNSVAAKFFKKTANKNASANHVIWIYDAWLTTSSDRDNDGYYPSFELTFALDTSYSHADVFAVIYLGDSNTYKEIHTTSVFRIHSDASNDDFTFKTELLQGFPSGDYDILIELYNADTLELQDSYDHNSDPDLSLVSLESAEYEHSNYAPTITTHEHGGSQGYLVLLVGLLLTIFRRLNWVTKSQHKEMIQKQT